MQKLYTVSEAAAVLSVSPKTLRNKLALGQIRCTRLFGGRVVRFSEADIAAMMQAVPAGQKKAPAERHRAQRVRTPHRLREGSGDPRLHDIMQRACAAVPEVV